ncbi:helix-turn-helix domain-containing protein [Fusobacterium necrophorum subsp. funduliforme]|uniref:helix-turn-helix domain-containing protein n=1 Tax=Fusobacterium necrophorum TaxID=859 RepID=UPI0009C0FCAE|nr:helix-turn-helix transcriptional regulator [Fusobacterium necrophorum]AYV93561.1 XRE family transcriptional regulator [Fusobacterium necrophorum subsp. funduliforme]AYV95728.1 XRE family transcriptional regulator [Fusobacterium necrophorum subsp. funduliforme]MDK4475364.1 helix-turn-helix domain-containing protein [Fusobacterium necrophorum]MDK4487780.1 helix-turn-helix domain-containing protein [Fusobacterium necrophorum]MDK4489740.1 helix-turn-helix domain-containing protein [Fusobacteriu
MDTGKKLKEKRLQLGLTLEEVGKIVGVAKSTVRKWETGDIENMKKDKIVLLAKALHVSPAFIMGLEDEYNNNFHISSEQKQINEIERVLSKNSNISFSGIKKGNKIDVFDKDGNNIRTYDVEIIVKAYERKKIKENFKMADIEELSDRFSIPDELKGITRKQYIKFMGESAMFFDNGDISEGTKEKLLLSFQRIFYDAKERNKRKK